MGAEKEIAMNPAMWGVSDLADYQAKMQTGIENLADIHDCDVAIGETPKDAVFSIEKVTLYKYRPLDSSGTSDETLTREPILIAYSLFGRYNMLDLQSDRSVVRNLLAQGHTVYIIDWGNPNKSDRWLSYDDYVGRYISDCVDFICHQQNIERLTLFGICEGGTFAACYASLFPEKLGALVLAVTPIDFHADLDAEEPRKRGYLGGMMRQLSPAQITDLIDSFGCLPGHLSGTVFREMTLLDTCKKYGPSLVEAVSGSKEAALNFLRMEKWLLDRPHHPAEAAKQWLIDLYHANRLIDGSFTVNGQPVLLENLNMPVLNIYAKHDHIIPPPESQALKGLVGNDCTYRELELNAGHIGAFVSRRANAAISEAIANWIPSIEHAKHPPQALS